jgi:hypothetical protein
VAQSLVLVGVGDGVGVSVSTGVPVWLVLLDLIYISQPCGCAALRGWRQAGDVLFVGVSHGSPPRGLPNNTVVSLPRSEIRDDIAASFPILLALC